MLDFKDWEKVAEDKKTTTLRHKKGHVMKLAHGGLPKIQQAYLKRLKLADGTENGPVGQGTNPAPSDDSKDQSQPATPAANITINTAPASGAPAPIGQALAQNPVSVQTPPTEPNSKTMFNNGLLNAPASANLEQQGVREQQAVNAGAADAQAKILADQQKAQADLAQKYQENLNNYQSKVQAFSDYNKQNPIDPNRYMESKSTGSKVATAIGMILSGAGSGVTGQPNMAMDYINKQIDRDIAAQQQRTDNQKTVLGSYQKLYGDTNEALTLTKASMNDLYANKIAQVAAQQGTASAKAQADIAIAKLMADKNKLLQDASQNKAIQTSNPQQGTDTGIQQTQAPSQGAPAQGASSENNPIQNIDYKILKPGADEQVRRMLRFDSTVSDSDKAKISSQMTQASQAEKGLSDIRGKFTQMANEMLHSGVSGYIHRTVNPHVIAGIGTGLGGAIGSVLPGAGTAIGAGLGTAAGEALGQAATKLTDTQENRKYDSDKTAMIGYVSAALKGTNIGGGQIEDIVSKNLPEYNDEKETLQKKLANIRDFIINHTETDALKRNHYSYR